jgi:hypothetical protein
MKKKSRLGKMIERIQDIYYKTVPYDYRPSNIWYKIKCVCWERHTEIKCRYLPLTWVDRTKVLPHTMFEILSRFIEEECSPGHIDWEGSGFTVTINGKEKNVRQEMQDLYDWWHQSYIKEYKDVYEILWKEVEKHPSTRDTIPVVRGENDTYKEVPEDEADFYIWEPEYNSPEDGEISRTCLMAINKLERIQDKKLQEMMHRLVDLTPYLWT